MIASSPKPHEIFFNSAENHQTLNEKESTSELQRGRSPKPYSARRFALETKSDSNKEFKPRGFAARLIKLSFPFRSKGVHSSFVTDDQGFPDQTFATRYKLLDPFQLASPISLNPFVLPFATTSASDSISTLDSSRSIPDQLTVHLFGGPVQQSSKVKDQKEFIARSRQTIKAFPIRCSRPDRSDSIHSSSRLRSASIRSCFRSRQHQLATRSSRWTARVPFPISSRFISLVVQFNNHLRVIDQNPNELIEAQKFDTPNPKSRLIY
ncbi:hypothetical protein F2Q69_00051073 [Brassica cretica]|uniref:Uncharacterized protein n=1 Tax=Brassica cretica TaxID=69181 RepID=A0A8S9PTX8_BRACR|nr:hypothetical protein F2Q69_00051073 [Brassica cretica]